MRRRSRWQWHHHASTDHGWQLHRYRRSTDGRDRTRRIRFLLDGSLSLYRLIRDRAPASGGGTSAFASIASTGFGLTALCIGDKRAYGDAAQIKSRVLATLNFLANAMPNVHGFYYHFVGIDTGARFSNTVELSDIDS